MTGSGVIMLSARCPHCRSIDFRSVGIRNTFEKLFHWILQPYRCGLCGRHFFLFRWQAVTPDAL
jgi:transposase-like protein